MLSFCRWVFTPTSMLILSFSLRAKAEEPLSRDAFVAAVLASNPSASAARALVLEAAATRRLARLIPDPVFELSISRARVRDDGGDTIGPTRTENAGSLQQVIPWPGTYRAGIGSAEAEARGLEVSGERLRWELEVDARQAFDELFFTRSAISVAREAEADARSLMELTNQRVELGESREVDRIKARIEWLKAERGLLAAQREETTAEAIVRTLAVSPLSRPLVLGGELPMPPQDWTIPRPSELRLQESPRYRAALTEAQRAGAQLTLARRSRVPDLGLSLFRTRELDREANGASVALKLPLWNANRGEIARAGARAELARSEAARILLDLTRDAERRMKDLELAVTQASSTSPAIVSAARRSVDLARLAYENGETSLLDLLDAQRTSRDAQRELLEARRAVAVALAEAQRLVGPGRPFWSTR